MNNTPSAIIPEHDPLDSVGLDEGHTHSRVYHSPLSSERSDQSAPLIELLSLIPPVSLFSDTEYPLQASLIQLLRWFWIHSDTWVTT